MSILTEFRLSVLEQSLGVYGIHVHQDGQTIGEHRFRSNDPINLCSASKTFVAIAVGIAMSEDLVKLGDYVADYFPELHSRMEDGNERITLEHCLKMSSGHLTEDFRAYNQMDRALLFLTTPVKEAPGESFFYEDLCTYMLGRVIEKASGQNLLTYLKSRLFEPLGIVNPQWHTCQNGHTASSGGLYLTTEEFSRMGILLLNKGSYQGRQILPTAYVEAMQRTWMDTSFKMDPESQQGYGYQVWTCTIPNTFRADGMYGQTCIILNDYNAVVTFTGHNEDNPKDTIRAVWQDILPKLQQSKV